MSDSQFPRSVTIREVGPREGFQILKTRVATPDKARLIAALVEANLPEIEVTSFVRPDRVPNMADAEDLVSLLPRGVKTKFSALYLNPQGFRRAEATGRLVNRGWLYTSPSESFLKSNNNIAIADALNEVPRWVSEFRGVGKRVEALMISTAFGCGFEGEIQPAAVAALVERYVEACAREGETLSEICLADTIGAAHPNSVRACVQLLRPLGIPLSLHLHDTRGLGLVNVYAGLSEGVSIFEGSVGGMGGCPFTPGASGNVATEDMIYLFHSLGVATGVDLETLCRAAELAESLVGAPLPGHLYRARLAGCKFRC